MKEVKNECLFIVPTRDTKSCTLDTSLQEAHAMVSAKEGTTLYASDLHNALTPYLNPLEQHTFLIILTTYLRVDKY